MTLATRAAAATLALDGRVRRWAALGVVAGLAAGCGGRAPVRLGAPLDASTGVPLARLLAGDDARRAGAVVVSGRIGELCRSSGCWFVLEDVADGKAYNLLVDLKPAASFTVPPSVLGRLAVVSGRLVGQRPDLQLQATGLELD